MHTLTLGSTIPHIPWSGSCLLPPGHPDRDWRCSEVLDVSSEVPTPRVNPTYIRVALVLWMVLKKG